MKRAASLSGLLALAAVLFVLRFGYDYGAGDQDDLFPVLLHQLDASAFAQDWYVTDQGGQFTVRTPFLWLMQGVMLLLPLWAATLAVWVLAWLGVAWGVARLADALGASPLASWASTLVVLVGVLTWTLGGNVLVSPLLAPEMIAWALALPAVRLATERRTTAAGALLGLAAYVHLLVGALVTGALGLAVVLGALDGSVRDRWRLALRLGGAALAVALPMIVAIARYRIASPPPAGGDLSTFFLFAELRLPHHYLPSTFAPGRWARFAALTASGVAGLAVLRRTGTPFVFAERLLLAVAIACLASVALVEGAERLFVAQLQLFKLTVLANAVLVIAACAALTRIAPSAVQQWRGPPPTTSVGLAIGLLAALGLGLASGALDDRIGPWHRAASPITQAEDWIRTRTPPDAVVAVPPNSTTFRLRARRAVVVTFKAAPFQDGAIHEWYDRLLALAPAVAASSSRGLAFGDALDGAYALNQEADWARLVREYGVTHVLRRRDLGTAPRGPLVFEAGPWAVYDVALSAPCGEGDPASEPMRP